MIDKCEYGKENKIKLFETNKSIEKFIYVLSSKVVDENNNKIYLNINSLDCVAISDVELDAIDRIKE